MWRRSIASFVRRYCELIKASRSKQDAMEVTICVRVVIVMHTVTHLSLYGWIMGMRMGSLSSASKSRVVRRLRGISTITWLAGLKDEVPVVSLERPNPPPCGTAVGSDINADGKLLALAVAGGGTVLCGLRLA